MKIGDMVRTVFDHMHLSILAVNEGYCFEEFGVIVDICTDVPTANPVVVEFSLRANPNLYKSRVSRRMYFYKEELVLCNSLDTYN